MCKEMLSNKKYIKLGERKSSKQKKKINRYKGREKAKRMTKNITNLILNFFDEVGSFENLQSFNRDNEDSDLQVTHYH